VRLDRLQLAVTAILAATCLVSIFAAEVALGVLGFIQVLRLAKGETRLEHLPLDGPILAFAVWTCLSASFSREPLAAQKSVGKLVLFAVLYLATDALRKEGRRERVLDAAMLGGLLLASGALLQYYFLDYDLPDRRPTSFLGHWMTASGLCMAVLVLAASRLAFRGQTLDRPARGDLAGLVMLGGALSLHTFLKSAAFFPRQCDWVMVAALAAVAARMALAQKPWPSPATGAWLTLLVVPTSAWALLILQTRNAWLGALAGLVVVGCLKAPRSLFLLPALLVTVWILRPDAVTRRLTLADDSARDRYYMWQAGIDMISERPVFGQGPGMVEILYPEYRWPGAPSPAQPHLHNNVLQIAAERGLPCVAWWLWLVAAVLGDSYREVRRGRDGEGWVAVGALGVLCAMMAAGLFEYNFGDSEPLMFTLLVASLPYSLRRGRA